MSAFPRPALSAIAYQLAAAIEEYQGDVGAMLARTPDLLHCKRVSRRLDDLLVLKGALPQLSVQMVELLVCHTELMHLQCGALRLSSHEAADLVARHREAAASMRRKCLRLYGSSDPMGWAAVLPVVAYSDGARRAPSIVPMTASTATSVRRNDAQHRFELEVDGQRAGLLQYREQDGVLDLLHTEVEPAFEGRGLAANLARAALDHARASNQRIVPSCSYVAAYIERHPQYQDLVAG